MTSPELTVRPLTADGRRAGPDTPMTGIANIFTAAGFTEVVRPKHNRAVTSYGLP
jgi:hypothetical protein